MSLGPPPPFEHLQSDDRRATLVALRRAVAPILENNLLPHFTDHSVSHSDRVAVLADQLIVPIQSSPQQLRDTELGTLYAGCYLHDIGLQYENAGTTQAISRLGLSMPWSQMPEHSRRELLRKHHHVISAELVQQSATATPPLIGMALPTELNPALVAALCEAHAIDSEGSRYHELMKAPPSIRMYLISGILRLADILDECQDRAPQTKARTLLLDIEAQTHWWRNYYTEEVGIDTDARVIRVCFDFPPERENEYSRIVPRLQMPWIEQELGRHDAVFHKYGLVWSLTHSVNSTTYSTREPMPETVLSAMLDQLFARQRDITEKQRYTVLQQFREAQPNFQRRLEAAEEKRNNNDEAGWLCDLARIAGDMWHLGAKQSAWTILRGPFSRKSQLLEVRERLQIGTKLALMILDDGPARLARDTLLSLTESANSLAGSERIKAEYYSAVFSAHLANLEFAAAREAFNRIARLPQTSEIGPQEMLVMLEEAELLLGFLEPPPPSDDQP